MPGGGSRDVLSVSQSRRASSRTTRLSGASRFLVVLRHELGSFPARETANPKAVFLAHSGLPTENPSGSFRTATNTLHPSGYSMSLWTEGCQLGDTINVFD